MDIQHWGVANYSMVDEQWISTMHRRWKATHIVEDIESQISCIHSTRECNHIDCVAYSVDQSHKAFTATIMRNVEFTERRAMNIRMVLAYLINHDVVENHTVQVMDCPQIQYEIYGYCLFIHVRCALGELPLTQTRLVDRWGDIVRVMRRLGVFNDKYHISAYAPYGCYIPKLPPVALEISDGKND